MDDPSELRRRRRNRLRRPPRLLRIAALARWPRPLGALLAVIVLVLLAVAWSPFLWVAALVWGVWSAAAVADGALRGQQGIGAGVVAILLGPLGASITSLVRRRAIRKVSDDAIPWASGYALVALLAGFAVGGVLLTAVLDRGPHGEDVPRAAMGDRIEPGDRVLVMPQWMAPVGVGDIVAVKRFKGIDDALGATGDIGGVGRIVAKQNEIVGALDGALYTCLRLPDAAVGIQEEDGCEEVPEIAYLRTPTPDFGPIQVPQGTYWVLSDDRAATPLLDSRVYGAVPADAIAGRVVAVVSPLSRLGII